MKERTEKSEGKIEENLDADENEANISNRVHSVL